MTELSQTITKLEASHNPVASGQGFSLSAQVTPAGPHHVHGDVDFACDGAALGTARTDRFGVARIGVPGGLVHAGPHEFGAKFRGDAYNATSDAEVLVVNLNPAEGDPWPAEGEVEKFKGSNPPAPEPKVRPVFVKEPEPVVDAPLIKPPADTAPLFPLAADPVV